MMRFFSGTSLFALGAMLATASPALAQSTGAPPAPGTSQTAEPVAPPTAQQDAPDDLAAGNDERAAIIAGQATRNASGDIVVTGSRIARPNNRSAAPITTTTSAEIVAQGATVIEEVLNRLPQVQFNSEQNLDGSEGRQRIKLRSLGYERTLSLIDGLRFGLANTIDVGIIPTALVDRIDVLTGGASSVYGSDAVSGVINYVLLKNFEGVRLDGNYSFYNHDNRENAVTDAARRSRFPVPLGMTNDGARVNVNLAAGVNLFDNRVNITGFVGYRQSDLLQLKERSHSACEVLKPTSTSPLTCSLATFTAAGTIIPQSGPRAGQILVNNPNGNRTFVGINSGPNTSANPYDEFPFQRSFERVNAGGFLTAEVTDDIEFYSSGLWYRDQSSNPLLNRTFNFGAYGTAPYQVNCNNPFLSGQQATDLCGANAGSATAFAPIDLRYRFDGLPPVLQRFDNEAFRIVAGIRGRGLNDVWSYDLAGMISRGQIDSIGAPFAQFANVSRSLDVVSVGGVPTCRSVVNGTDPSCRPFNAFIPFNADPAVQAYLFGPDTNPVSSRIPRLLQFLGTVSGDLGKYGLTSPLAKQGVALALGVEYRDEMQREYANAAFRAASGGVDQRFTQNILEANVEVQAPLVEDRSWTQLLQLNGGYRLSKYNRLENKFDTWKVEALWSPIDDITFRGSYNKSQAAPGVTSAAGAANVIYSTGFYADPCAPRINPANPNGPRLAPIATIEQCRRTGLPDNLYNTAALICPNDACTVRDGGFNLTPESAFTKTFGVVLRPRFLPGLTVSIDRFLIDLQDELTFLQPQNLINGCLLTGDPFFCRGIIRNPGSFTLSSPPAGSPATGFTVRGAANGFKSQSHGWDFQGQYNLNLGSAGRFDFGFNGSLMTRVGSQESPTVTPRNCVGYFGRTCGESLPRWSHQFRTTWFSPDRVVSVSANWRHRGAMPLDVYAPADTGIPPASASQLRDDYPGIGAYDYFDLSLGFDVTKQMSLRLSANNLFDTDPPIVPDSRSTIGLLRTNSIMGYELLGRQLVASVSLRY